MLRSSVPALRRASAGASLRALSTRPIFFDMTHSNNAARIRLWLDLKEGIREKVETRVVTYPDLQTPEFAAVNPLKKVPALIRDDGVTVFESAVILDFLEDKYGEGSFTPATPEERQLMGLIVRCHDLYVSSPNCTAPGFSHCQGAMYLSTAWHGPARGMDLPSRAAKVAELWKQLSWLEATMAGPCLAGPQLSLADLTWFPTAVFMKFLLPRALGWDDVFAEGSSPFPKLAAWYGRLDAQPAFAATRADIWGYWEEMEAAGQLQPIVDEVAADETGLKFVFP